MPKFWAYYGHFLGTSKLRGQIFSTMLELSKQQSIVLTLFGHNQPVWAHFGHILGTNWDLVTFWAHYGHFWGDYVQNMTIPTSCCSAVPAMRTSALLPRQPGELSENSVPNV